MERRAFGSDTFLNNPRKILLRGFVQGVICGWNGTVESGGGGSF